MKKYLKNFKVFILEFVNDFKGEKTIRSETSKVFLVIFAILLAIGSFTVFSSIRGANTFTRIQDVYLKQFQSSEKMTQRALEIIGIYYLLASDQDQNILMTELQRYDELAGVFQKNLKELVTLLQAEPKGEFKSANLKRAEEIRTGFDMMNEIARNMTFSLMEGKKEASKGYFNQLSQKIGSFKKNIEDIEESISVNLQKESSSAKGLLEKTTWAGFFITFLGILATLFLISYLMKFLSVSLLPISNLMHNMRQAVFAVDPQLNVISPVSKYSTVVFDGNIVGRNVNDFLYSGIAAESETRANLTTALGSVFHEDEIQWSLMEDLLPPQIQVTEGEAEEPTKIIKLSYTPLWNKEGTLESLMIVAEDVTEVEKLRLEGLKKSAEINILVGISSMDRSEVSPFLDLAKDQVYDCKKLLETMEQDIEARLVMFRTLHTLKGNSRMFGLNTISEAVHSAESVVVSINKIIASGEPLHPDMRQKLIDALDQVENVLGDHFATASRIFGIENSFSVQKANLLKETLVDIEASFWGHQQTRPQSIERLVQKSLSTAAYFKADDLFSPLNNLVSKDDLHAQPFETFSELSMRNAEFSFVRSMVRPLALGPESLETLCHQIIDLSRECLRWLNGESTDPKGLIDISSRLIKKSQSLGLSYPWIQAKKVVSMTDKGEKRNLESLIKPLWSYMIFLLQLEGINHWTSEKARSFDPWKERALAETPPIQKILAELPRHDLSRETFLDLHRHFAPTSSLSWDLYIGHSGMIPKFEDLFEAISQAKTNQLTAFVNTLSESNPVLQTLVLEGTHSILLFSELGRLLIPKLQSIDHDKFGLFRKMVELPESTFHQIVSDIKDLSGHKTPPSELDRVHRHLHDLVVNAFDLPLKSMLWKMNPMVKEFSHRLNKKMELKITGAELGMSRILLYDLRDAFVHMIRNALDHGIEAPATRLAAGKPETGTIQISATENPQHNTFELIIQDDGAGINITKLVNKAIANEIITASEAERMTEKDKINLIFRPNLSTKDDITDISGRGVGMDAVRSILSKLQGSVEVVKTGPAGTVFRLELPRTPLQREAEGPMSEVA